MDKSWQRTDRIFLAASDAPAGDSDRRAASGRPHPCAPRGRDASGFSFAPVTGDEQERARGLIRNSFARAYGARIRHFMPDLWGLHDARGRLVAACGLRPAAHRRLFLETYLTEPVEQALSRRLGESARRDRMVEVGNLAVLRPGYVRHLICALTAALGRAQVEWVVCTAVPGLRNGFRRLGIRPVALAPAPIACLPPEEQGDWGSYYDTGPEVIAVSVAHARSALSGAAAAKIA